MTNLQPRTEMRRQDMFGRQVAARLSTGATELPHDITERLRASRVQALARRKIASLQAAGAVSVSGNQATLGFGDEGMSLWSRIGAALPLIALAVGLIAVNVIQNERRASEVAEVDAALLTDDLPPAAYADPGFVQFLKSER
jgi:hypothetical protein